MVVTERGSTMALGVRGVRVGTWQHDTVPTGCTVLLPPEGSLAAVAIRGQSPGTREAAALGPFGKLTVVHAVVLSGGSAYGLAVADGVARWLERAGTGYPVGDRALVPIVGAAIVLDLGVHERDARPNAAAGVAACDAASEDDPAEGSVGAGVGCTVAKVGGFEHAWRGGQAHAVERVGELVVAALVVNNAVGEVRDEDGTVLVGTRAPTGTPLWPRDLDAPGGQPPPDPGGPTGNTVIGAVVTNARLDKSQAYRVADLAHDGIARAIEPSHTSVDGDALFCVATGEVEATVDRVAQLAVRAVARAARRGPLLAPDLPMPGSPFGEVLRGAADAT